MDRAGSPTSLRGFTSDRLPKAYGHPFVIENRAGAGGAIGTEYAARSASDGYTIFCAGGAPFTIVPQMQKLAFDPVKDLAPVGMVTVNGMALTVTPGLPVHSLAEFIAYVKAHPGEINYSVGGVGTMSHLSPALLSARHGLNMVAVPYQSMPPTITALLAGTVQMFFGNISDIIEPIRSGKLRLLAVSTEKRSPEFPDVPTISEIDPGLRPGRLERLFRACRNAAADHRQPVEDAGEYQPRSRNYQDAGEYRHRHRQRHAGTARAGHPVGYSAVQVGA